MKETDSQYISSYGFLVRLGSSMYEKVCFSKISGIESTLDYEEIFEGGYNTSPHLVAIPHKKHATLVLEKGAGARKSWISKIKPGMKLGTWLEVTFLDNKGKPTNRQFYIQDGLITKWELSGLDAMKSEILIERLEIMHEGIQYL